MTAEQFRRLALSFPEAYESSHQKHPDFRLRGGKLFATLAYPDKKWGKLRPAIAAAWCGAAPKKLAQEFEASFE